MKHIFHLLVILLLFSSCENKIELDESQSKTFNKFYGNSGEDEAVAIRELADGGLYIFGTIETADKSTELALIRTDKNGNEIWTKTFGRQNEDVAGGIDIASNGNIIMVGTSSNPDQSDENNLTDVIVVELDQDCNLLRTIVYDNLLDNERGNCILYDKSSFGGFVIGGTTDAFRSGTPQFPQNEKGILDFLFIRSYSEFGIQELNFQQIGLSNNDNITSLVAEEDNLNFLFTGTSVFRGRNQPIIISLPNLIENSATNGFENYDIPGECESNKIIKINNGYAIIGTSEIPNDKVFIQEVDESDLLPIMQNFSIPKNRNLKGTDFTIDEASNSYIICGSTNNNSNGGFDHYMASVGIINKNINWEKIYGGSGEEQSLAIWPAMDGGYIIGGSSGFEGNSLINVIKTDNKGVLNP